MNAHNIYKYIKTLEIENKKYKALYDKAIHSDVQRFCELQKCEKALDKACFMLEKEQEQRVANVKAQLSCDIQIMTKNEWKEWCMKADD